MVDRIARRVLIIADAAHATPRISEISAILPNLGWGTVIVTCNPFQNGVTTEIIVNDSRLNVLPGKLKAENLRGGFQASLRRRIPFISEKFAAQISKTLKSMLFIPDEYYSWQSKIDTKFEEIAEAGPYDVVLSSSSPVSTHVAARRLSRKLGVPWVADLRDLWSDNHNYSFTKWRQLIDRRIERRILSGANAIITVNNAWVEILERKFGERVRAIENACKFNSRLDYIRKPGIIRISSLGPVYPGKHNLEELLHLLSRVQEVLSERIILDVYGDLDYSNRKTVNGFSKDMVEVNFHSRVTHEESWKIQCQSDLLVLFTWQSTNLSTGHIPLRSYEFAACGRPIITMTDHSDLSVHDFLPKGNFHPVNDPLQILKIISEMEVEQKLAKKTNLVDHALTYSHRAHQFIEVFETVIGEKSHKN